MSKDYFSSFGGGITDLDFHSEPQYSVELDNFLIKKNESIEVRPGGHLLNEDAPRVPQQERISNVIKIDDTFLYFVDGDIVYIDNADTFQTITGPTGNKAFPSADADTLIDVAKWGDHYICGDNSLSNPVKLFKDNNGDFNLVSAGIPIPASDPVITPSIDDGESYLYAFVHYYEYNVGTTLFADYGEPRYVQITDGCDFTGVKQHDITLIPTLANSPERNYDTANIKVRVFRTQANGTVLYYVGEVTNGTSSFIDNVDDTQIVSNESLYTTGGVRPNELPPRAKYVEVANNIGWYGNIIEGTEEKPYRLKFSIISDPDSVPADYFEDFDAPITGLSSVQDKLLVFTEDKVIRLEGSLDDTGRGTIVRQTIADVGCISNSGIVKTQRGCYFPAKGGIYFTDGYQHQKLTHHLDQFYAAITNTDTKSSRIFGTYDRINQRAYFTYQDQAADSDKMLVYDEVHSAFSTISGGLNMGPASIIFDDTTLVRCDTDGYIFKHEVGTYGDKVKSDVISPELWHDIAVFYTWKHIAYDHGDSSNVKWTTKVNVTGKPTTNMNVNIDNFREGDEDANIQLTPIEHISSLSWGDAFTWGVSIYGWNSNKYLNQSRRMKKGAIRSTHRQLGFSNAYVLITNSINDTDSYVTVNDITKQVVIVNPATYSFGENNEGHDIIIDGITYEILSGTEDTITVDDPDDQMVSGTYEYEIRGYPKFERPHINSFSLYYDIIGGEDKVTTKGNS